MCIRDSAGIVQAFLQEFTELVVFYEQIAEFVVPGVPAGIPVLDNADSQSMRINLLSQDVYKRQPLPLRLLSVTEPGAGANSVNFISLAPPYFASVTFTRWTIFLIFPFVAALSGWMVASPTRFKPMDLSLIHI